MKRLFAVMIIDARLQFRNGFYYAAAFVAVIFAFLLRWVPTRDLAHILPALVLSNLLINTFYFIGGLVLLEKGEGTLEAQVVTPLRSSEYLASKVITLTLLSLAENLFIVIVAYGTGFNSLALIAGVTLAAAPYCLYGFLVVVRYDSINEYLFPSILYTFLLPLPLLNYFGVLESWLHYLHPFQAPLLILQAAFEPVESWQVVYGVLYSGLWIGLLYRLSERAFKQFVIAREGVR